MTLVASKPASSGWLDLFLRSSHRHQYIAKTTLIESGNMPDGISYIVDGSISVIASERDDRVLREVGSVPSIPFRKPREMILTHLGPGQFFGEMGLFNHASDVRVVTRTPCELATMDYQLFHQMVQNHPEVLLALTQQMALRYQESCVKMVDLAFLDVLGRVTHALMSLVQAGEAITHPKGMQIRITRLEIAQLLGCSREMVGRVLTDLNDRDLIAVHGKTIVVYDHFINEPHLYVQNKEELEAQ